MKNMTFRQALDSALEKTGRSLRSVATAAGVSYDLLKNLRQGKSQTTNVDDARRVAGAFNVTLDDFLDGTLFGERPPIAVAGRVGAGAVVPLIDAYEKGDGLYHVATPPQLRGANNAIVAVEVEGDSMAPMYQSGDVLFYSRATHDGVPTESINRPCVVEDESGQAWVKQVKLGDEPGLFHLISLNPGAETRHNQRVRWAARVRFVLPAEMVERVEG